MKFTPLRSMQVSVMLLVLVSSSSGLMAKVGNPPVVVTPVLSTVTTASGQPIILPSGPARVMVSTYVIAPGARLPVHQHVYPRYAYLLDGQLRVTEVKTHRTTSYRKGDFVVEMIGQEHFGENIGDTPLRLLVIDLVPKNVNNNSRP